MADLQKSKSTCTRGTMSSGNDCFSSGVVRQSVILLTTSLRRNQKSRNIVNMALALRHQGYNVLILTTEVESNLWENELSKIRIKVVNLLMPQSLFGYFGNRLKLLRTVGLSIWTAICLSNPEFSTIVLNDTCAVSIPILKYFGNFKVMYFQYFYQLESLPSQKCVLSITPTMIQNWAINYADQIIVQNHLSGKIFNRAFSIDKMPKILYPCIDIGAMESEECLNVINISYEFNTDNSVFFLITGAYHPRSNFELAIDAFEHLYVDLLKQNHQPLPVLVIAGKYNELDEQQRKYLNKLLDKSNTLNCSSNIVTLKKFSTQTKKTLLTYCLAILHTTTQELFGNQILDAMYMGRPVITCNDGVGIEYVTKRCGILVKPSVQSFATAMDYLLKNKDKGDVLGVEAKNYFCRHFSFNKFAGVLNCYVERLIPIRTQTYTNFEMGDNCKKHLVKKINSCDD